jgi:DNA repair protein RadC
VTDRYVHTPLNRWPEGEGPRDRLLAEGPAALSTAQLLAVLLRTGGRRGQTALELARGVLAACGGLAELAHAAPEELQRIAGLGPAGAAVLAAALELGRRGSTAGAGGERPFFRNAAEAARHLYPRMSHLRKEQFVALLLDGKNRLIRQVRISEGSLTASVVHPREAFLPAVRVSAAAVIFAHNHPSGDPTPSSEDRAVTEQLRQAGRVLGITVLDHLVVGDGRYRSLAEEGLL